MKVEFGGADDGLNGLNGAGGRCGRAGVAVQSGHADPFQTPPGDLPPKKVQKKWGRGQGRPQLDLLLANPYTLRAQIDPLGQDRRPSSPPQAEAHHQQGGGQQTGSHFFHISPWGPWWPLRCQRCRHRKVPSSGSSQQRRPHPRPDPRRPPSDSRQREKSRSHTRRQCWQSPHPQS